MKKLWSTTVVGKDVAADTIFHFHQVRCCPKKKVSGELVPDVTNSNTKQRPHSAVSTFLT